MESAHRSHTQGAHTEQPQRPTATDRVGEPPLHPSDYFFFVESPSGIVFSLLFLIPGQEGRENGNNTNTDRSCSFPSFFVWGGKGLNTPGRICCLPTPSSGRVAAATDRTNDREGNTSRVRPYPSSPNQHRTKNRINRIQKRENRIKQKGTTTELCMRIVQI